MEKYQDYAIKDGKLVGKFEEMYQKFDNPWHQASNPDDVNAHTINFTLQNIRRFNIKSIVEFGCGLGYVTNAINKMGTRVKGIDISSTAITKAKKLWPNLDFEVDNIKNIKKYTNYDAVLFAHITWFILDDIDRIFDDMLQYFNGRYFLHNVVFYKGQQQYGTKFFTNLKEFIDYVPFQLIGYSEATTMLDDAISTSTIFKIVKK